MLGIGLVAVYPLTQSGHTTKDVDILHLVADGASNLEVPSLLEMLSDPAAVSVGSFRDDVVSVDDDSKNPLLIVLCARTFQRRTKFPPSSLFPISFPD